ncbi:MAG: shikimate dehydrogenase [Thermodesulfobacteriota bacterium]|nr:shikimate dehydrogenase [Thermodesulfobacteriota bacterium]
MLKEEPGFGTRAIDRRGDERDLEEIEMIDAQTELYGIIGNPVKHSLSPMIHNRAFRRMGLNAIYLAFEVKNLNEAIAGIRGLGIRGVSVTIPFKTEVVPFLDEVEGMAEKIKAVNTIVNKGGRLIGYNTDWCGALEAMEEKVDLKGKRAIILGAGGSARAIAYGLILRGCQVIIVSRCKEKAIELAKEMGCLYGAQPNDPEVDVIINCTPVGMYPLDDQTLLPREALRREMTVMDVVYQPLRTRFLREAEERGCRTIDGLEMLAHQGAAQLEIWTGMKPEIMEIKEDLCQVLGIEINRKKNDD